jgi:signal transduction histidine kinase
MKIFILLPLLVSSLCFAQRTKIDSLKNLLQNSNTKSDESKILLGLCEEFRSRNADSARLYGTRALKLAQQEKRMEIEVEALNAIGVTHESQGNYAEALVFELNALTLRRAIGDDPKTAKTLNDIGIVYDEKGDYSKALVYYFEARKIFEKLNDLSKIAMVINNIGIVLKAQKEFAKVVGYYQEALTIYKKINKPFGIAACHANLGSVYFNLTTYDSALYYSLLASREFEALNNRQFLAAAVCNAGMAYDKLGREMDAQKNLLRAKKLYEEFDNKRELAFALIYLAGIDRKTGNLTHGITTARQGLAIAKKIDAREQIMQARAELAELYAANRDFSHAFTFIQSYNSIKDSLFELEKSRQIAHLQTQFETEKKENKINSLTQENELKDIRLRQNEFLIIGLAASLLTLLVFGLLWQNRIKLKQQAALQTERAELREQQLRAVIASQEEERKRFAADLHDGLGQMISALRLGLSRENPDPGSIRYALDLLNAMNVEIRDIAFNLMPQVLMKEGLHEALKEFASRVNKSGGIKIAVQSFDINPSMASEQRIALYRICQEWTNNAIKYSGCKAVSIQAVQHPNELVITIDDDGNGFDKHLLVQGQGNGWKNINSRLNLIHGHIEIDSMNGRKGTTAIITAPSLHESIRL